MSLTIKYGIENNLINITEKAFEHCLFGTILYIPIADRTELFGDPLPGIHKCIFISISSYELFIFNDTTEVLFNISAKKCLRDSFPSINYKQKLQNIQYSLVIKHGSFLDEYPEQLMVTRFLKGHEKVLEIGANLGRNSLIIASILHNSNNLVSLETDFNYINGLTENKNANMLNFHIENAALSKRKLIQKGWNTEPSDIVLPGYTSVNIVSYEELMNKYNIQFDTLILDCEGAFYYILMDMPEILTCIKLIIMENDYIDIIHKDYVDAKLLSLGFNRVYSESGGGGVCYDRFYEVWKLE